MLSFFLISSLFLATCGAQNFSLPASPLETVADSNGRLFVSTAGVGAGEGGRVYRLSGDSLREEEVLQLPAGDGVLRMALSSDHSRLVVCFANRSCSVYNSSDLNAGAQRTVEDVSLSSSSMALFTAPVSGGGDSFYAASVGIITPDGDPQDIRLVQYGFAGAENSVERASDFGYQFQPPSDLGRTFAGGFVENSNAYFVAVDNYPDPGLRIMRVCDTSGESDFPAVYEAVLNCAATALTTKVPSVSVVRNPGETWVVLSSSEAGTSRNQVCSYLLSSIDQELDETYTTCNDTSAFTDIPLSWLANVGTCNAFSPTGPCNFEIAASENPIPVLAGFDSVGFSFFVSIGTSDGITASVAFNVEVFFLVYVAYTESPSGVHHLRAYDITSGGSLGLSGSFSDQKLDSQVRSLALDPGLEHLFVTDDSNSVFLVPLEECSSYGDCGGCVASGNLLCGWCTLEQKCSRQSQCQNSNETKRYVSDPAQCINASVSPDQFISEQPENLEVSLSSALPPLLPGESYECVLTAEEGGVEIAVDAVISTSTTYSCNITVELPPQLELVTNLNLRSTLVQELFATVEDAVTLYQCPLALSCSECLQTEGACGWCVYDKTCSVLNSTCRNETDFYTVNMGMGQTYQEVCPALLPSPMRADGYYTQPAGVGRPLQINTTNLPQEIEGYSYVCRVSRSNGGPVDLPATYNSPDSLTCTVDASDLPLPSGGEETVGLSIVWQGPGGLDHALDEQDGGANLVLYQCSQLAQVQGCSSCLGANLNTSFTCGWCSSTCQVMEDCSGGSFVEVSAGCPGPTVTGVDPPAGPLEGGTTLTITGTDLGTQASDIASVTVGGSECVIDQGSYKIGTQVVCVTGSVSAEDPSTNLVVSVMRSGGSLVTGTSTSFSYLQPMVGSVSPVFGPMAGGTKVVITGTDLDIGNKQNTRVQLRRTECTELSISSGQLNCTSASDMLGGGPVMVFINNATVSNDEVEFSYRNNPSYESVSPMNTIPAGGVILTFTGMDLDVAQRPTFVFTLPSSVGGRQVNQGLSVVCNASGDGTSLECVVPPLPASGEGGAVPYDIIMDAAPGPNASFVPALQFTSSPNPNPVMLRESDQMYTADSGDLIEILGQNLDSVQKSEYRVTVGGEECVLDFVGPDRLSCLPPQESPSSDESEIQVMVFVGQNLGPFDVGSLTYVPGLDIIPIIAGVGGGVVGIVLFFLLVICIVVCCYQRKGKEKEKKVQNLLSQMEHWELEMADECKRAFTELQTDLADLVQISDRNFPFRDFRSFAMRFLFPSAGDDHPVLNPLALPPGYSQEDVVPHLETFKDLLMDKKFLLSFVRTLEAQGGGFTLQDRCNVASLLMVVFQNNLIYATDILQTLLSELMQKSIGRGHPKLLLRRTESVAEKMLANWLCFLLYPHILEHAGEPLFILYRAIKSQLEKGPVDVITGEAKHSLSEEKLLRQHLDFMPVEGVIETVGEEKIPIKLLDTDSITQAKEKILDTLYKNAPVSSRPQLTDVDLELRQSGAGITLRDQDQTNITEGDWMKVNTLGHFKLAEMSKAHLDNPKYPQPKFMLVPRPTRPVSGVSQLDMLGTIIANMSVTSRSSLITSGELAHVYHLVKPEPEVGNEESALRHTKIMSEVFLSRLLSTKRILQPYVDDLFNAVFTIPRGKLLPPAIKSLFDFLDLQAAQLNIEDPEVLHTWKTNSLPLRFWVNLIKNPDFIFDINKSATVDACLTVIAQAYIDACSTAEQRYSKDTPTARLLYVNEVKKYKEHIRMYYDTIQSLPKLLPSELEEHLRETAQHNQLFFVTESALMELYKYALEYSADLTDTLNEDGLTETVEVFDKLKANLHIKS